MTEDDVKLLIKKFRQQSETALAELRRIDQSKLPEHIRTSLTEYIQEEEDLLAVLDDDSLRIVAEATDRIGRPLTEEELRGLFIRQ